MSDVYYNKNQSQTHLVTHETFVCSRTRGPSLEIAVTAFPPAKGREVQEDCRVATLVSGLVLPRNLTDQEELLRRRIPDSSQDTRTKANPNVVVLPECQKACQP